MAAFRLRIFEEHLPCGYRDYRSTCRFQAAKRSRLGGYHAAHADRILRVRSYKLWIRDSVDSITGAKSRYCVTNLIYDACQVRTQSQRKVRTDLALTFADDCVPRSHARGCNTNQNLIRPRAKAKEYPATQRPLDRQTA